MKHYRRGGIRLFLNFCHPTGTVFPTALAIALPCAALTGLLVALVHKFHAAPYLNEVDSVMKNPAIWSSFNFLVSFLVVFRTSQSYSRFWDGCTLTHKMGAEWFNSCAALISFCRFSQAAEEDKLVFVNTLIRLYSMLHAAALGELEDTGETRKRGHYNNVAAYKMELIDIESIDEDSLRAIREADSKVELIFQWVQQLIVQSHKTGILNIEPPILTRAFQEFARGMAHFHDARTVSRVPFPFPYAVTCDLLLVLQWLLMPFVVCQWCSQIGWGVIFAFVQIFTMWALNLIAVQLENPFGSDPNDIDGVSMQHDMNSKMRLLFQVSAMDLPKLRARGYNQVDLAYRVQKESSLVCAKSSFEGVWESMSTNLSTPNSETKCTMARVPTADRHLGPKPAKPRLFASGDWEPLEQSPPLGHTFSDTHEGGHQGSLGQGLRPRCKSCRRDFSDVDIICARGRGVISGLCLACDAQVKLECLPEDLRPQCPSRLGAEPLANAREAGV